MRVISGKCRGTHLVSPEGSTTRPTTDRIKETLFNIIAFDIPQCHFLDLFSGSGAIGIESLSRGAEEAVFVEKDRIASECIEKNLEHTRLRRHAIVYTDDVLSVLDKLKMKKQVFDIIFMDPPYALSNMSEILNKIIDNDLLTEDGYIILERSTNTIVTLPRNLVLWKEKTYKTTTLSFFRKELVK